MPGESCLEKEERIGKGRKRGLAGQNDSGLGILSADADSQQMPLQTHIHEITVEGKHEKG